MRDIFLEVMSRSMAAGWLVLTVAVIAGAFLLRWLHYARRRRRYGKKKNL